MTKLFTSQSLTEVELLRGVLEQQGIASTVRNQYTSIGRGEIPFTETWPELWVVNDADLARSQALLAQGYGKDGDSAQDWTCANCGEEIEAQFTSCWNCSQERSH